MKGENYQEKDYKKHFKKECVACGKPIKKRIKSTDWEYYKGHGNYCISCNLLAGLNSLDAERQQGIREFGKLLETI